MGTWASSVTTAVAPLCWESKTFLCTVSGADSITQLPHQGFLIRTQPNSTLQVSRVGEFILSLGAKKVFTMIPQTPFTQATFDILNAVLPKGGATHQSLIYDDKKTTYRTEVDQALRTSPDLILANGYTPDSIVLLKDLYRAGFKGKILGFAYSINQKLIDQIGGVNVFVTNPVMDDFYPMDLNPNGNPYDYYRVAVLPGSNHLDGVHALQYVRSRHGDQRGDFARSERQQQLLLAIKSQAKHWNVANLPALANAMNGEIKTSIGIDRLRALLAIANEFDGNNIHRIVLVPPFTAEGYAAGQDVLFPNWGEILPAVHQSFP